MIGSFQNRKAGVPEPEEIMMDKPKVKTHKSHKKALRITQNGSLSSEYCMENGTI